MRMSTDRRAPAVARARPRLTRSKRVANIASMSTPTPLPAARANLAEQVYATLKAQIHDFELVAGDRFSEAELGAKLGVSRTPVREALSILEQEGFVRTIPRRGIFIVRKSKREIIEMIQVMAALEAMSARLAALCAPDAQIGQLRHLFDEFTNSAPAEHIGEYSDANIAFHQMIIRLGGSQLIADVTKNLFIHVRAIRKLTISQDNRAARSIVDHLNIIEALERRDTELAERLTRQHTLDLALHVERYGDFLD